MSDDVIPQQILLLAAIVVGIISIYLTAFPFGTIFSVIAVIVAVILGTNTLRHIGNYSLGTGIPSIVYLLSTCGLISMIAAMSISNYLSNEFLFPLLSVVLSIVLAWILALICRYVFGIEIEILAWSFMGLSMASNIALMGLSTFLASTYNPNVIFSNVIFNGLILLLLLMCVMTIQNPYNSCMGSNEDQLRTLTLALSIAFLMFIVLSVIGMLTDVNYVIFLIISIIGWILTFKKYYDYSLRQAAEVKYHGFWTKGDEGGYYDK
ncbi:MAG: tetrahydromethanopterin S-methyltransferase subunit C [Methanosphaera sp.]|nr:tetrahydromethanopterin S-methyltransferase subunit C [Methanosphaera sp.]